MSRARDDAQWSPDVSIVVPARNEGHRLPDTLRQLDAFVSSHPSTEVVLAVDTASTDDTVAIAQDSARRGPHIKIVAVTSQGKGHAIVTGVRAAEGDVVLMADTDLAVAPSQFPALIEAAAHGALAIGSRSVPGAARIGEPKARFILGRAFNLAVRVLVLPGVRDSQCGFKAFERTTGLRLFEGLESRGWAFDVELLARARTFGVPIEEVPVEWHYGEGSSVQPLKHFSGVAGELWNIHRRLGRVRG